MRIATGKYIADGTSQYFETGFRPDLVIIKGGARSSCFWTDEAWCSRSNSFSPQLSNKQGVAVDDRGFRIGNSSFIGTSTVIYHWLAIADDGEQALETTSWQGNGLSPTTYALNTQKTPALAIIKRDTAASPIGRHVSSTISTKLDGAGSANNQFILGLGVGTITVDGQNEVNELDIPARLGEGCALAAFFGGSNSAVVSWVGDGVAGRTIGSGLSSIKAALFYPENGSSPIRLKTDTVADGAVLLLNSDQPGQDQLTFSGGNLVIGPDTTLNTSGVTYRAVVFGADSGISFPAPAISTFKAGSGRKVVYLPGRDVASRIELGTSDSLKIDGALSLEWMGQLLYQDTTNAQPSNVGPLILRHGGDITVQGNLSWGLMALHVNDEPQGLSGPSLNPVVTNVFTNGPFSSIVNNWRTGILPPRGNRYMHWLVTHDGLGGWKFWLNGKLVKQRQINLVTVNGNPNIQSGAGHRTTVGARWDGSAYIEPCRMRFGLARVYSRALTTDEVQRRFARAALGTSAADVSDFVEEWDAANASGTALPATKVSANNGLIVNGSIVAL